LKYKIYWRPIIDAIEPKLSEIGILGSKNLRQKINRNQKQIWNNILYGLCKMPAGNTIIFFQGA